MVSGHINSLVMGAVGVVLILIVGVALYPTVDNATDQAALDVGGTTGSLFQILDFIYIIGLFIAGLGLIFGLYKATTRR